MELLTVGKISGTHHLKGAVKIIANIGDAEILEGKRPENDLYLWRR